jgi:hypothetical protein
VRTEIQKELDRVEEYILNQLFGDINNPVIDKKLKIYLTLKGITFDEFINSKIEIFEEFAKKFMREDGFLDGEKLSKVISIQYPILSGLNLPTARLIDYVKLIPIERVKELLESF